MSKNHYIPRLWLRQFAVNERINTYNVLRESFATKKIKDTFCDEDLFPPELEEAFAKKLEGPFGDLLNNKLLADESSITINRKENMLIRKFQMVHILRSTYTNMPPEELLKKTQELNHPAARFVMRNRLLRERMPSDKTYLSDLLMLMQYDTIEDILDSETVSPSLHMAAMMAAASYYAVWDSTDSGEEFILPKLPGISLQDQYGALHKLSVLIRYRQENLSHLSEYERLRLDVTIVNLSGNVENYLICPLSPTRALVGISQYFKLFFPEKDYFGRTNIPKLLDKEQFHKHFFEKMRMDLFEPCSNYDNKLYTYKVKQLTSHEVHCQNALAMNEEQEEFAFHDYTKIRDSFWEYEHTITMQKKKHDYSKWI